MNRIVRAVAAAACILLAVLLLTVSYLQAVGLHDAPKPRSFLLQPRLAREGWSVLRERTLALAGGIREHAARVSGRLRAAYDGASRLITGAPGRLLAALERLYAPPAAPEPFPVRPQAAPAPADGWFLAAALEGKVSAGGLEGLDGEAGRPPPGGLAGRLGGGGRRAGRVKTAEEKRVEQLIEQVFSRYFKEYTVAGRRMRLRMPFALNEERESGRGHKQIFFRHGKGAPEELWPYIEKVLASREFARYAAEIASPGEKAVVFNLTRSSYSISRNRQLIEALASNSYPGTATRIFVRRSDAALSEADVYNYLYAVAAVGVDCSGFVYHVQSEVAKAYGLDLDRILAKNLKVSPREVRVRVGLGFFDPESGRTEVVEDRIVNLRPGDLILFRGSDGKLKHSAIIQSIDLEQGSIRYLQSTDWAPEAERGVHDSTIHFDPERADRSLRHYSVRWLQQVRPPFEGEEEPRDWQTDADRYLWYTAAGGSLVARPRYLAAVFFAAEPRFYTNFGPEERTEE